MELPCPPDCLCLFLSWEIFIALLISLFLTFKKKTIQLTTTNRIPGLLQNQCPVSLSPGHHWETRQGGRIRWLFPSTSNIYKVFPREILENEFLGQFWLRHSSPWVASKATPAYFYFYSSKFEVKIFTLLLFCFLWSIISVSLGCYFPFN